MANFLSLSQELRDMIYEDYIANCDEDDHTVTNILLASRQVRDELALEIYGIANFRVISVHYESTHLSQFEHMLAGTPYILRRTISKVTLTAPETSKQYLKVMHSNSVMPTVCSLWYTTSNVPLCTPLYASDQRTSVARRIEERWAFCLQEILKNNLNVRDLRPLVVLPSPQFAEFSQLTKGEQHDAQRLLHWFMVLRRFVDLTRTNVGPWTTTCVRGPEDPDSQCALYWVLSFEDQTGAVGRASVKLWQFEPVEEKALRKC